MAGARNRFWSTFRQEPRTANVARPTSVRAMKMPSASRSPATVQDPVGIRSGIEAEAGLTGIAVKAADRLPRVLLERLSEEGQLSNQIGRERDDVTADRVGLDDVENLPRAGPEELLLGLGAQEVHG